MKRAYIRISWGLVLALFDFRIQSIDLLPDGIGYLLIMLGLTTLKSARSDFRIAWGATVMLLVLSIARLGGMQAEISLTDNGIPTVDSLSIVAATIVIDLAMLYGICGVIRANAQARGRIRLANAARNTWHANFAFGAGVSFLLPFQLSHLIEEGKALTIMVMLGYLFSSFWVILLARRASRELPGQHGSDPDGNLGRKMDIIA
ncbi:hypothetical protein [Cohnella lupini]|uniref:Uncharacterized protein n=1 Tax=Cohnella lupini TaxID=1294267 RepID=A0A3D9IT13_9BACL|nr:hypothetical protein [Cohnella lupini]RED64894.1 hypothetical protein DFP95_102315 [Cohnella lupini]